MSLPLAFHPSVYDDVEDARRYYERRRVGLGDRFVAAVEDTYARMQGNPYLFGAVRKTVRFARVNRFPYVVYFQIEPNQIYVLAVLHSRRGPRAWSSRV